MRTLAILSTAGLLTQCPDLGTVKGLPLGVMALLAFAKNPLKQRRMLVALDDKNNPDLTAFRAAFASELTCEEKKINGDYHAGQGLYISSHANFHKILEHHFDAEDMEQAAENFMALFDGTPDQPAGDSPHEHVEWRLQIIAVLAELTIKHDDGRVVALGRCYPVKQAARSIHYFYMKEINYSLGDPFKLEEMIKIDPDQKKYLGRIIEHFKHGDDPTEIATEIAVRIQRFDDPSAATPSTGLQVQDLACDLCLVGGIDPNVLKEHGVVGYLMGKARQYKQDNNIEHTIGSYPKWIKEHMALKVSKRKWTSDENVIPLSDKPVPWAIRVKLDPWKSETFVWYFEYTGWAVRVEDKKLKEHVVDASQKIEDGRCQKKSGM